MEVILNTDIAGLGEEGDIKNVKDGYARNYLIPKKMAVLNNKRNRSDFEARKEEIEARKAKKREEARSIEEKIKNVSLVIEKKAGDNGKLFGSVTNIEIAEKLIEQGIEIDRRRIEILKPIKVVGDHQIRIRLHESIQPEITVKVDSIDEAERRRASISEEELKKMEEEQAENIHNDESSEEESDSEETTEEEVTTEE